MTSILIICIYSFFHTYLTDYASFTIEGIKVRAKRYTPFLYYVLWIILIVIIFPTLYVRARVICNFRSLFIIFFFQSSSFYSRHIFSLVARYDASTYNFIDKKFSSSCTCTWTKHLQKRQRNRHGSQLAFCTLDLIQYLTTLIILLYKI